MKKFLIFISLFLYLVIFSITAFKLKNSVSPLKKPQIIINDQILSSAFLQISFPLIADSNKVFFTGVLNDTIEALFYIDPRLNKIFYVHKIPSKYTLSGFAKENSTRLFMLTHGDNISHFVLQKNNTISVSFQGPSLHIESISSIALVDGVPEMITINDSVPILFNRYVCLTAKNYQWEKRAMQTNPFFARISSPMAAYYKNNWYFMSSSDFFRNEDLYIKTPSGTNNIMVFRSNPSYHFEDIRVERTSFQKNNFDQSFSGLLMPMYNCSEMYSYNPATISIKIINCPEGNYLKNIPVFFLNDEKIERLMYFRDETDASNQFLFRYGQNLNKFTFVKSNERTIFTTLNPNLEEFALTKANFITPAVIPIVDEFLFLLDNGQYCILDKKMQRTDKIGFFSKALSFIIVNYDIWIKNLNSFSAWVFPFMLVSFPVFFVICLFLFFIVKVFLTPKRPRYSSRKRKSTPFGSFFFPMAIIYILGVIVFAKKFVTLLKII